MNVFDPVRRWRKVGRAVPSALQTVAVQDRYRSSGVKRQRAAALQNLAGMRPACCFAKRLGVRLPSAALLAALAVLCANLGFSQSNITTLAGYAGSGSSNGTGAGALFSGPQAVAVDGAGRLYVA